MRRGWRRGWRRERGSKNKAFHLPDQDMDAALFFEQNEGEWTGKVEIRSRKKSLAVSVAWMAIF